jgi:hypothetical protein
MAAHLLRKAAVRGANGAAALAMARAFTNELFRAKARKRFVPVNEGFEVRDYGAAQIVYSDETQQWIVCGSAWTNEVQVPKRVLYDIAWNLQLLAPELHWRVAQAFALKSLRRAFSNRKRLRPSSKRTSVEPQEMTFLLEKRKKRLQTA